MLEHNSNNNNKSINRIAILGAVSPNAEMGGAERFYEALTQGFNDLGMEAKLINIPADESSYEQILKNYEYCKNLDLSEYDLVISTKSPTYAINHPLHILYLVHTIRVFDDLFQKVFFNPSEDDYYRRHQIQKLDYEALKNIKSCFALSNEVATRLYRWCGVEAKVIHPPLGFNKFYHKKVGDYFFLPGRLHAWKRVDLLINAIKRSSLPLQLIIAGTGEEENSLKLLAKNDSRIQFLGRISDEDLVKYYANALAIPFVPIHEDYGYITLEAFASGKPVITCTDSGEPTYFVRQFVTGLIAEPTPESLCIALEWMYLNQNLAEEMGNQGYKLIENMSWKDVAKKIVNAASLVDTPEIPSKVKITILDMQPIDPPVGGGRQRLLGLYHNLGKNTESVYVGTYDWPGELYRAHALSDTLFEIDIPLSDEHHNAANELAVKAGGKNLIDLAFSQQGILSQNYIIEALKQIGNADIIIFSHPWIYPLVKDSLRPTQIVIYESHNVEGYLRTNLLDVNNLIQKDVLNRVVQDEYDLGCRADWILACSHEDLLRFNRIYDFSPEKIRVIPNGIMAFTNSPPTTPIKLDARLKFNINSDALVAIFIGSNYDPNIEAAQFIIQRIAPLMPEVIFIIAGGVGQNIFSNLNNIKITGVLDEAEKSHWYHTADIALNPMMSGSGTNIKMFEFLSYALPVITTAIGARGIECGALKPFIVCEAKVELFVESINSLKDYDIRNNMGIEGRKCVENNYSWERISNQLGIFLKSRKQIAGQSKPMFSVVVPTYERHLQLDNLISCLQNQVERDFEVILVDQSINKWKNSDVSFGFPLTYFHSPIKGAISARNAGATIAQGLIIAFIDDDCEPDINWLLNARQYFLDNSVVGLEGFIFSNCSHNDPEFRPVTNENFEGIGFMTANLMVRSVVFQFLGGFDLQFDNPHFREDTDFGWRLQEVGEIPYAKNVKVFHPAQSRLIERESELARSKFFKKDALLYKKHPLKYKELFHKEAHYKNTKYFIENLLIGFKSNNIEIPIWLRELT